MKQHKTKRAFALPIVLVITLIVTAMIGVLMQRQAAQRLLVERQVSWYQEHHARYSLDEIITTWVATVPDAFRLDRDLGPEGELLQIDLGDGTTAYASVFDGQGSILEDLSAVSGEQEERGAAMLEELEAADPFRDEPQWRRRAGPVAVSLWTSPEPVLRAAIDSVLDGSEARGALSQLIEFRESLERNPDEVLNVLSEIDLEDESRDALRGVVVEQPTLYLVRIDVRDHRLQRRLGRSDGLMPIDQRQGQGGATRTTWQRRAGFLTWERVQLDSVDLNARDRRGRMELEQNQPRR
ncbi:MAG: hypothetical protein AAF747_02500 [Planctomycetota bacterium]